MNTQELFQTMLDFFQACGIPILRLNAEYDEISRIDLGFRRKLSPDFHYQSISDKLEHSLKPDQCCLFEDELHLSYAFLRFGKALEQELGCHILCIGPVLFHAPDELSIRTLMENYAIPSEYFPDFVEFFNQILLLPSYDHWICQITFFLSRIYGHQPEVTHLQWSQSETLPPAPSLSSHPEVVALQAIADRYAAENRLISAVSAGNIEDAERFYVEFRQFRIMSRVPDPVRDQKNLLFTLNTLMRKAAEYGQVHPFHIDRLSTQLAIQIEHCTTPEQVRQMGYSVVRKYCILVNNYSRRSYPSLIQNCMNYIDFYYGTDLSLDNLARICSVSKSYLSVLFRKETGITITEYINQTRIRESIALLNTTGMPIGDIAAHCGFPDANYFSRIFRKLQGQSPRQYRAGIQRKRMLSVNGQKEKELPPS